jgi:hypothetical protein
MQAWLSYEIFQINRRLLMIVASREERDMQNKESYMNNNW